MIEITFLNTFLEAADIYIKGMKTLLEIGEDFHKLGDPSVKAELKKISDELVVATEKLKVERDKLSN